MHENKREREEKKAKWKTETMISFTAIPLTRSIQLGKV